jgi:hypothetical protein
MKLAKGQEVLRPAGDVNASSAVQELEVIEAKAL